MKTKVMTFTINDMEKAYLAGADKRTWTKIKLSGVVSGDDFIRESVFEQWYKNEQNGK